MSDYKNVLLVGNGPSILHAPYGKVIDEFDGLVARFNHFVLDPVEYTGTRTDVWIVNYDVGKSQTRLKKIRPNHAHLATFVPNGYNPSKNGYRDKSTGIAAMLWYLDQGYSVILHGFTHFQRGAQKHYYSHEVTEKMWHHGDRAEVDRVMKAGLPVCRLRMLLIRRDHWWKKRKRLRQKSTETGDGGLDIITT